MKFWYKLDNTFKLTHVNTYFRINLKGAYDDVKSFVISNLYVDLLMDELNEIIYEVCISSLIISHLAVLNSLVLVVFEWYLWEH